MDEEIQEFRKLLEQLQPKEGEPCAYCGILSTDDEHVIPCSYIEKLTEMRQYGFNVKVPKVEIVRACRECNLIASNKVFKNFKEKKAFIKERLHKKYKRFVKSPEWTDKEISELQGHLKEYVILMQYIRKIVKKRLKW